MRRSLFTIIAVFCALFLLNATAEARGNKPCSGKKGGVVGCTADGKFKCANGTLSASKKTCTRR